MLRYQIKKTSWGKMLAAADDSGLLYLSFFNPEDALPPWMESALHSPPFFKNLFAAVEAYMKGDTRALSKFKWKMGKVGTPFQRKVWKQLEKIPPGKTKSYGEIAKAIQNPRAYRAVGGACNANPILMLIPCHRVTGTGNIGGFGLGLRLKKKMLSHENPQLALL